MDVAGYHLQRHHQTVADRVAAIADQAAAIVGRTLRLRLDHVEIVVAEAGDVIDLVHQAESAAIGTTRQPIRQCQPQLGHSAISPGGVLVVINATAHRKPREIDITVVHELVHVAQFSRPGERQRIARNLRNNYGIDRMSWLDARSANRQVAADEREAVSLERLARQL